MGRVLLSKMFRVIPQYKIMAFDKRGLNRKNLQKLATYLYYGKLPKDVEFDMSEFTEGYDSKEPYCNTAGCAVGFGPFAGIPKLKSETFFSYSERVFIRGYGSPEWWWCFAGPWNCHDNTPKGAAKRIQYLLDGGEVESDFEFDPSIYAKVKVKKD